MKADFSGIQFTLHFMIFFVVETKFVGSTLNMIVTRQTCGQRSGSSMSARGKHCRAER